MSITVSIVDGDTHARDGLGELINRATDFSCISRHATAEDAIRKMPGCNPNVVLMNIDLPGVGSVGAIRKLKPLLPQTQFVMLAASNDSDDIFSALMAGANGCLLKQTPPAELLLALREVCAGGALITGRIARKIVEGFRQTRMLAGGTGCLSPREQEVLGLLSQGYLYKEIAEKLQIGYRTVSTHLEHIYGKLHVRSRAQAVAKHFQQAGVQSGPVVEIKAVASVTAI